ncbi:glycosyltransferase 87 family protein [Actinomadura sp. NPDC047616]|uniref:glycosyltransferase 87 family protein n=1 Tax=Actinomadura sp. NPDC047616 TaxID=3155914 RepID=UPI0033CF4A0F
MRAAGLRSPAEALVYGASAVFAAVTAAVTHLGPHRVWGTIAAVAYGLGAVLAARRGGGGPAVPALVAGGAVLVPLAVLVATGHAQPEVGVVHRSGAHLLEHGTPYLPPSELAGGGYEAYNPYLPGMALLGVPHELAGVDARLVFAGVFVALLAASARLLGGGRARPLLVLAASPLVALPMTVGGDDLPVIGLVCAGLALAVRDRPGAAGLALGAAATLKATAWPALLVCLALPATRGGARRYATAAAAVTVVGVLPPALVDPSGMAANVLWFPLGLADVASPADSPLPGRLLADLGPFGHTLALTALGAAAVAMGVSLIVRPPRDVRAAADRLALGLALATALMPASRWGYLVYPAVLALWARFATTPRRPEADPAAASREEKDLCLVA